ncbi:MAG: SMC-Scp complex subunit ScpB [Brevinematales bacterium]|nr:SMC-Scp complex subunit ScpB [Brevinematales bacterium]
MTPEGFIEAILFVSGKKIKKSFLDDLLKKTFGLADIEVTINSLNQRYASSNSGLRVFSTDEHVEMVTSEEYYEILKDIFPQQEEDDLTEPLLETLTIIAYKQPIEKTEIDKIRGVASGRAISILIEKGFVKPIKNSNISDKISYITTDKFLNYFGLKSLNDLPDIESIKSSVNK